MARGIHRLTASEIERKETGVHADGGGLYLRVTSTGARNWVFRYMLDGKAHSMGLGPTHTVSAEEARDGALKQRKLKRAMIDPIANGRDARRALKTAQASKVEIPTFGEVAEQYISAKEVEWKDRRHGPSWRSMLNTHAASLMPVPVDQINEQWVLPVLRPLWTTRYKLAKKLQGYIAAILAAAKANGHRTGDNPAAWRGHLQHSGLTAPKAAKEVEGRKALPFEEVPALVGELRSKSKPAVRAAEFLILTAARVGEVVAGGHGPGMQWPEIDLQARLWVVPKERMKGGVEHRVPLSDRAVAILREAETVRTDERVFHTSYWTVRNHLKALRPDADVHGFRSSFRDWYKPRYVRQDVGEICLAHYEGSKTVKAYDRNDLLEMRRPVMEAWADFCEGTEPAEATRLRRA